MAFEDIDDDMPMDKPADYYKDEYGICPHCKHKLSEEEMERKMCSKCLQKLSGEIDIFTRKGSSNFELVAKVPFMERIYKSGEEFKIHFDMGKIHLFDFITTKSIK